MAAVQWIRLSIFFWVAAVSVVASPWHTHRYFSGGEDHWEILGREGGCKRL